MPEVFVAGHQRDVVIEATLREQRVGEARSASAGDDGRAQRAPPIPLGDRQGDLLEERSDAPWQLRIAMVCTGSGGSPKVPKRRNSPRGAVSLRPSVFSYRLPPIPYGLALS